MLTQFKSRDVVAFMNKLEVETKASLANIREVDYDVNIKLANYRILTSSIIQLQENKNKINFKTTLSPKEIEDLL
jgi:hypothetical protein